MGPLNGIRIVDMTSVLMGPYATQILGDYGADVIKIESPAGDLVRQIGPARHPGMGPLFLHANRSKRSLALDLKLPAGRDVLLRLLADSDVLVYNVRPQAMGRLGLGYDVIAATNPRIIYAGLSGYGQDGPYADQPAYDDLIQGACGMAHLIARAGDGTPRYVPTAMADRIVGLAAVGAITATLLNRERTGRGQKVDIPMFETMVSFVLGDHMGGLTFEPPLDQGGYSRLLSPERRPFRTLDGYVCALVYSDKQWDSFLSAVNLVDLPATDPRFATFSSRGANIDYVYGALSKIFETRTTADWIDLLRLADIPVMPLHDLHGVLSDPHLQARQFFRLEEHPSEGLIRNMRVPVSWSDTDAGSNRPAPRLGEHSIEILREAGFAEDLIAQLIASGVITAPTAEKRINGGVGVWISH